MGKNKENRLTVAIDGYSSSGKSTLARQLAECLGYQYVDSGAMYRAVTLYFLDNMIDIHNLDQVQDALKDIQINLSTSSKGEVLTFLNGVDVTDKIRSLRVSSYVSEVSTIALLRDFLVGKQRAMRDEMGIVMDGRDIGTVVFPDANIKFFVVADLDERVERRYQELTIKGTNTDRYTIRTNLQERDYLDSTRKVGPLKKAPDSIIIDNTDLTREEQLSVALKHIKEKFPSVKMDIC